MNLRGINISIQGSKGEELEDKMIKAFLKSPKRILIESMVKIKNKIKVFPKSLHLKAKENQKDLRVRKVERVERAERVERVEKGVKIENDLILVDPIFEKFVLKSEELQKNNKFP